MTQAQLDRAVADRTGESLRTVHRLGFRLGCRSPSLEPEDLRLVVDCPFCGRPVPYPGPVARRLAGPGRVPDRLRRLLRLRHADVYATELVAA